MGRRGISVVSSIIAITIVSVAIASLLQVELHNQNRNRATMSSVVANTYAAELLELFRAHSSTRFNTFLAGSPGGPFPLCQKVNQLDRASSTSSSAVYLRRHTIADLPASVFPASSMKNSANRFFKAEIVNITTLGVVSAKCNSLPPHTLAANERFLVTVGVSWVSKNENTVSLSTVLSN